MSQTRITIDDHTEVRIKDNVVGPDGWHLWAEIYKDGEHVHADEAAIVPDPDDDAILNQVARRFVADWETSPHG